MLFGRLASLGQRGKAAAAGVASSKTGQSIAGSRAMGYAKKRPARAAVGGTMGLGAAGYVTSGRRGRAVDRSSGRPTGIRRF
jgi:hypothetical protein